MDLQQEIIDTWEINARINLKLLEAMDAGMLEASMNPRGRNVGQQFAHLHNVRLMWLEVCAPELAKPLQKLPKEEKMTNVILKKSLTASAAAITQLLKQSLEKGKVKNFKRGIVPFLGYMITHEGHHRGQILLHLKLAGKAIDKQLGFDIWEWDKGL